MGKSSLIRILITSLNLATASLVAVTAMLGFVGGWGFEDFFVLVMRLLWVYCAIMLWKAYRVWAWIGSLVGLSLLALQLGAVTLRFLGLFWQAAYGDRSIELDPSTIGVPLAGPGLITMGAMFLLVLLLCLPAWTGRRRRADSEASL